MTEKVPGLQLKGCFHYDRGFVYFREVDGRVLIGGARNADFETENTGEFGLTDFIRNRLTDFLQKHVVHDMPVRLECAWSGILGMGEDKSPIVQMVSERIAVAVRLSGIGVAIGSLVGETAADLILARL
jgi:glycine/D-amino acid oxidase-like deaminating enzyme